MNKAAYAILAAILAGCVRQSLSPPIFHTASLQSLSDAAIVSRYLPIPKISISDESLDGDSDEHRYVGYVLFVAIQRPAPSYPLELLQLRIKGEVVVGFIIDPSGRAVAPDVVSSTDSRFASAVVTATEKWRYRPGMLQHYGKAFAKVRVKVTFDFEEEPNQSAYPTPKES